MRELKCLIVASALALLSTTNVLAQAPVSAVVNETGVGNCASASGSCITFPGPPGAVPLSGVLQSDPGPGGLAAALTYGLLSPPNLVAGDVQILESIGGPLSDVIRFNAAPGTLVFYSDNADGVDALADTGFPTAFYANVVQLSEVGIGTGGVLYTPTATQPGFVPGFTATYQFLSDEAEVVPPITVPEQPITVPEQPVTPTPVPEPASTSLLVIAGAALAGGSWYRARSKRG
jgi:hypothetical protein